MSWFDRNRGERTPEEAWAALGQVVDAAGVAAALHRAAGANGLRRFVLRFLATGERVRITGVDAQPLAKGGGPPNPVAFAAHAGAVEAALATMKRRLPAPFAFERGAVGVSRGSDGEISLSFRFDEDADTYAVSEVPMPTGEGSPVEDPAYVKELAAWEGRIAPVRARCLVPSRTERWTLEAGRLTLTGPSGDRVLVAEPLALYWPRGNRFEWVLEKPAGDELPFVEPVLTVDRSEALELAVFAAARRGRAGVFQGDIEGEKGEILFAALLE